MKSLLLGWFKGSHYTIYEIVSPEEKEVSYSLSPGLGVFRFPRVTLLGTEEFLCSEREETSS
jgi:hypothetical protein